MYQLQFTVNLLLNKKYSIHAFFGFQYIQMTYRLNIKHRVVSFITHIDKC